MLTTIPAAAVQDSVPAEENTVIPEVLDEELSETLETQQKTLMDQVIQTQFSETEEPAIGEGQITEEELPMEEGTMPLETLNSVWAIPALMFLSR